MNFIDIIILLYYFIFVSLLIVAFVYDFKHKLIPDFTSYGIFIIAFIRIIFSTLYPIPYTLYPAFYDFLAALGVALVFGGIWFFSKERAMGFGDVKLAPAITLFLGFPKGILAILLSFWLGSVIGLFLILYSKLLKSDFRSLKFGLSTWTLKSEIPFGPFLVLGALIALLWGERIISLYLQLF